MQASVNDTIIDPPKILKINKQNSNILLGDVQPIDLN